jgi:xanthine dehydrogenase small subunit
MNNSVKFVLDDKIIELDFSRDLKYKPTTTVLNYLRDLSDHKGVKEGCAEGDCGACTVALGELDGNKISYKAVDSCLVFLPMIHGKQIITVENLKNKGELHPVQSAMVECFGSQCGYCTPGFIMSLFALYKNHNNPSKGIVEDALSGNLCRCTGYQFILYSALMACQNDGADHFSEKETQIVKLLKEINKDKKTISLITNNQCYFKPFNLDDALLLRKNYPDAILINGASDIALRQTKNNELLKDIIDLSAIDELKRFEENDDGYYFGSGLSLEALKNYSEKKLKPLYDILKVFGSLQIRNLATIGGNIGSASPIGDTLPVLIAYGAKVILQSAESRRDVSIEEYIKGYRKTDLRKDEIITSVFIPKLNEKSKIKTYKVSKRKDLDISTVSSAFRVSVENEIVKDICMAYGGMAEITKRAKTAETYLLKKKWSRTNIEVAMELIYNEFEPLSDARAESEFRRVAAKNLLMKFFNDLQINNGILKLV